MKHLKHKFETLEIWHHCAVMAYLGDCISQQAWVLGNVKSKWPSMRRPPHPAVLLWPAAGDKVKTGGDFLLVTLS
jgi:hypothetical protein